MRILLDPHFGVPSQATGLERKYSGLTVDEASFTQADRRPQALATSSFTSSVRQKWTIFGITYTEVKTTMGYAASGGRVISVNRCYGSYVNYVPLRSIDGNSWYTLGNGLADCWTEWTLARPLQSTVTGIQGLRVNGYGQILKVWYV